jgi:hypothetical protein
MVATALSATDDRLDPRFARPRTLFFGIGAQKAATTWLDHYLRGHAEICLPRHKEQHYWTTLWRPEASRWNERVAKETRRIEDLGALRRLLRSPRRRSADRAWLLSEVMLRGPSPGHSAYADVLFQTARGQPVVGEITPAYGLLPTSVFGEMSGLGADVRFIFILRDPVDRLVSGCRMIERRRDGEGEPWPVMLRERLQDPEDLQLERSRYDLTIERLEAAVVPERIAYFFYETLFRQSELDRLCAFLGVARLPATFDRKIHADPRAADPLPREVEDRALELLAPTYAFVRARFGDQVPAAWRSAGLFPDAEARAV